MKNCLRYESDSVSFFFKQKTAYEMRISDWSSDVCSSDLFDLPAEKSTVDFVGLARAARAAQALFPAVGSVSILRTWAGLEAKTDDLLPVIGPSPAAPGVLHAFGFSDRKSTRLNSSH